MKQIMQTFQDGNIDLVEAPEPNLPSGHVKICSRKSLVSLGTERSLVEFGRSSYWNKLRQQPEKARQVMDKIKTDGFLTTMEAVKHKLTTPIPLGYSNVGVVSAVADDVTEFQVGDRVVSNGAHADVVVVAKNLCAKIPNEVSDDDAIFTVLASIALQGIRLVAPSIGETVVVIGAGLIGLLTIQMLQANGCRVLALDIDPAKLELAKNYGAEVCLSSDIETAVSFAMQYSSNNGVDAVLITAATSSSDPISQAAQMSRQRGRIVLVGVVGLNLRRSEFYEKELTFQVSCSYGPGRYDSEYEDHGHDYPFGLVRWTEQRNFQAVLEMLRRGQLRCADLISHRFAFNQAEEAYDCLTSVKDVLGIALDYPENTENTKLTKVKFHAANEAPISKQAMQVGVIGAGNYAARTLLPAFSKTAAKLHSICSATGSSAALIGKKFGFSEANSCPAEIIANPAINCLVIATRHNTHAEYVIEALNAGKHVFVEKPLAMNLNELSAIQAAYHTACLQKPTLLQVGFNRRFAPLLQKMKQSLQKLTEPKSIIITVNAGQIPRDHWIQDPHIGGGRILGEGCHFIDLLRFLVGHEIIHSSGLCFGFAAKSWVTDDKATLNLHFADGSIGTIHYFANGSPKFPKERVEVFCQGRVLQLDNFLKLSAYGWPGFKKQRCLRQDKGQRNFVQALVDSIINGKTSPIPIAEIFEVSRVTIELAEQLRMQR